MVRHPFERIVSAFQDKFIDNNSGVFRNIKKKMISTYGDASFISFVKMIISSSQFSCNEVNRCTINRHWKPFIRLLSDRNIHFSFFIVFSSCAYCNENYTFILKAETFTEDLKFLGMATNISFPYTGKNIFSIQT